MAALPSRIRWNKRLQPSPRSGILTCVKSWLNRAVRQSSAECGLTSWMLSVTEISKQHEQARDIIRFLSSLSEEDSDNLDVSAFRGLRVAFQGTGAPPGATNDLITSEGFYIRVVNPAGRDLRPHCVSWSVWVSGIVMQVFAMNKLIVLEVSEQDWEIGDTT